MPFMVPDAEKISALTTTLRSLSAPRMDWHSQLQFPIHDHIEAHEHLSWQTNPELDADHCHAVVLEGDTAILLVARCLAPDWQRFCLTEALGNAYLIDGFCRFAPGVPLVEPAEARVHRRQNAHFATSLLAPPTLVDEVMECCEGHEDPTPRIAEAFGIPTAIAEQRRLAVSAFRSSADISFGRAARCHAQHQRHLTAVSA